jgi:hypothetical protein
LIEPAAAHYEFTIPTEDDEDSFSRGEVMDLKEA